MFPLPLVLALRARWYLDQHDEGSHHCSCGLEPYSAKSKKAVEDVGFDTLDVKFESLNVESGEL